MGFGQTLLTGVSHGQLTRYAFMAAGNAGLISDRRRYELGLVDRPHYAYGVRQAALEARALGYAGITAIEFGVAGGNGLLVLEEHAQAVERETGVRVHVVGFDSGTGLPAPVDYRDAPFLWTGGDFAMDEAALRSRLRRSELVLGDVRDTAAAYVADMDRSRPIGFVSFDLDYWSSTVAALNVFRGDAGACMPRVWCYFDDVVAMIEDIGELLAVNEFNEEPHGRRIRHPWTLQTNLPFRPAWANQMFQAHLFDHPDYGRLLTSKRDRELPLEAP